MENNFYPTQYTAYVWLMGVPGNSGKSSVEGSHTLVNSHLLHLKTEKVGLWGLWHLSFNAVVNKYYGTFQTSLVRPLWTYRWNTNWAFERVSNWLWRSKNKEKSFQSNILSIGFWLLSLNNLLFPAFIACRPNWLKNKNNMKLQLFLASRLFLQMSVKTACQKGMLFNQCY